MKNIYFDQIHHLCILNFLLLKKLLLHKHLVSIGCMLTILLTLFTACTPSQPEETPVLPTSTQIPPTSTQIPATATSEPTATATLTPTEVVIPRPQPQKYVSFAFDSESNQIIVFGGNIHIQKAYRTTNETWAYDVAANKWTLMNPSSSPPYLSAATMAYDSESDRVILFGGSPGERTLMGTWAYDFNTNTWTQMSNGPKGHLGGRMVYDAESDRIIHFGGLNLSDWIFYDDTWAYDYNTDTWTNMKPSIRPMARNYHSIVYDAKADRVLIFGAYEENGRQTEGYSMWSYDFNTNTWQELLPGEGTQPLGRLYSCMAYDAESDRSILFGGDVSDNDTGTWAYDYNNNTWQKMNPDVEPGPGRVSKHHMEYIPSLDRVFLFGGSFCEKLCEISNDLWVYDFNTNAWEKIIPNP